MTKKNSSIKVVSDDEFSKITIRELGSQGKPLGVYDIVKEYRRIKGKNLKDKIQLTEGEIKKLQEVL